MRFLRLRWVCSADTEQPKIERREAIARERADQQVVCSGRWDAYGRDAYGRDAYGRLARWAKERVATGGVRRGLGLDGAGDHLAQVGEPHWARRWSQPRNIGVLWRGVWSRQQVAMIARRRLLS